MKAVQAQNTHRLPIRHRPSSRVYGISRPQPVWIRGFRAPDGQLRVSRPSVTVTQAAEVLLFKLAFVVRTDQASNELRQACSDSVPSSAVAAGRIRRDAGSPPVSEGYVWRCLGCYPSRGCLMRSWPCLSMVDVMCHRKSC